MRLQKYKNNGMSFEIAWPTQSHPPRVCHSTEMGVVHNTFFHDRQERHAERSEEE